MKPDSDAVQIAELPDYEITKSEGLNGNSNDDEHKRVDIRRNDTVKVITGRDKGKEGRVLRVFPDDAKVLVEHVMVVKKHVRPNPQRNMKGGIAEQESRIAHLERAVGVRHLRPGAHRTRSARRAQSAGLQEVRNDAGQVASSF